MTKNYMKYLGVAISCLPAIAYAQDANSNKDVIIVTGSKTSKKVLDTPAAITVFTEKNLEQKGIKKIANLQDFVPNLYIGKIGMLGENYISIRGINSSAAGVNRTAVYIDDIPYFSIDNYALSDVKQVEVLRGPQGVLFGANSESGTIIVTTSEPSETFGIDTGINREFYKKGYSQNFDIAADIPINEKIKTRLYGAIEDAKPYTRNIGETIPIKEKYNNYALRGTMIYEPNENTKIKLLHSYLKTDGKGMYEEELLPMNIDLYNQNYQNTFNNGIKVGKYELAQDVAKYHKKTENSSAINLKYKKDNSEIYAVVTHLNQKKNSLGAEADYTAYPLFNSGSIDKQNEYFSEMRLKLNRKQSDYTLFGISGRTYRNDFTVATQSIMGGQTAPSYGEPQVRRGNDLALFFSNSQKLFSENLTIALGARYEWVTRKVKTSEQIFNVPGLGDYVFPGADKSDDFTMLLPSLSAVYALNNGNRLYFSAAKGWQSGGYNVDAFNLTLAEDYTSYKSETLWSYEIGSKGKFYNDIINYSAAIFYTKAENWQEPGLILDESGYASSTYIIQSNGSVDTKGIEIELRSKPLNKTIYSLSLGLADGKYGQYKFSKYQDYSKNTVSMTPKYNIAAGINYAPNDNYYLQADFILKGKTYLNSANTTIQKAFGFVNLSAGGKFKSIDYRIFADNIFDEYYFAGEAFTNPSFPDDGVFYSSPGKPRSFGIELKWRK